MLPPELRIASLFSTIIFLFGMVVVLEKAGIINIVRKPKLITGTVWFLVVLFGISAITNAFSPSNIERWIMFPLVFLSSALCYYIAKIK